MCTLVHCFLHNGHLVQLVCLKGNIVPFHLFWAEERTLDVLPAGRFFAHQLGVPSGDRFCISFRIFLFSPKTHLFDIWLLSPRDAITLNFRVGFQFTRFLPASYRVPGVVLDPTFLRDQRSLSTLSDTSHGHGTHLRDAKTHQLGGSLWSP